MGLRVLSLNVKGLRDPHKVTKLKWYLAQIEFDVLFLQETHVVSMSEGDSIADKLTCRGFWGFGGVHSCGVGILVKKFLNITVAQGNGGLDGRFFVLDLSLKGQGFRFVNVYLPNVERERCVVLRRLYNLLNSNRVTLLGGDFNFVENLGLDKCGGGDPLAGDGGTRVIRSIKNDFSLVDVFRTLYPTRRAYSFSAQGVSTRLDGFYLSSTVVGCVMSWPGLLEVQCFTVKRG